MNRIRKSIAIKSIAGIVLLLTIFCVIVGQIGYQGFTNAQLSEYAEALLRLHRQPLFRWMQTSWMRTRIVRDAGRST